MSFCTKAFSSWWSTHQLFFFPCYNFQHVEASFLYGGDARSKQPRMMRQQTEDIYAGELPGASADFAGART